MLPICWNFKQIYFIYHCNFPEKMEVFHNYNSSVEFPKKNSGSHDFCAFFFFFFLTHNWSKNLFKNFVIHVCGRNKFNENYHGKNFRFLFLFLGKNKFFQENVKIKWKKKKKFSIFVTQWWILFIYFSNFFYILLIQNIYHFVIIPE